MKGTLEGRQLGGDLAFLFLCEVRVNVLGSYGDSAGAKEGQSLFSGRNLRTG